MLYTPVMTTPTPGLERELYRLFEGALAHGKADQTQWMPLVDIRETDQELLFAVEIVGSDTNDIEVTTDNSVLTIRGERSKERSDEARYHLVERGYGSFVRRFQLPEGVEIDKIQADAEDGLLQVRIPKLAMPQPKTIPVKALANGSNGRRLAAERSEGRQNVPGTTAKIRAAK